MKCTVRRASCLCPLHALCGSTRHRFKRPHKRSSVILVLLLLFFHLVRSEVLSFAAEQYGDGDFEVTAPRGDRCRKVSPQVRQQLHQQYYSYQKFHVCQLYVLFEIQPSTEEHQAKKWLFGTMLLTRKTNDGVENLTTSFSREKQLHCSANV